MRTKHHEFPPATEVTTVDDVKRLADEMIENVDILTHKKHRRAVLHLIGRLYKLEAMVEEEIRSDDESQDASNADMFKPGDAVVLVGLSKSQKSLNGEVGTVRQLRADKGKYELQLQEGEPLLKVRAEHMVPVATGMVLTVGAPVAIRGLRNHVELNGCLGRIVEHHEEMNRFEVRATDSGQLFRVRQENLVPVDAKAIPPGSGHVEPRDTKENREPNVSSHAHAYGPQTPLRAGASHTSSPANAANEQTGNEEMVFPKGSIVQLVGLRSSMNFNGAQAEVTAVDRVRNRYEILLADGTLKTIRAENVLLVSAPKSSPASRRHHGAQGAPA